MGKSRLAIINRDTFWSYKNGNSKVPLQGLICIFLKIPMGLRWCLNIHHSSKSQACYVHFFTGKLEYWTTIYFTDNLPNRSTFGVPFSTSLCVAFEEVTGFIVSVGHHSICGRILVSQPFRINRLIDFLFWVSTILDGVAGWELLASGRVPFGDVADTGHIFATASEDGKNVNLTVK